MEGQTDEQKNVLCTSYRMTDGQSHTDGKTYVDCDRKAAAVVTSFVEAGVSVDDRSITNIVGSFRLFVLL